MKKSIIITGAIVTGVGLLAASTFAATGTNPTGNNLRGMANQGIQSYGGFMGGHGGMRMMYENWTEAEKTAFEAMNTTEKRVFLEKKHDEMEAKRDAHEIVIDKLLAGTALTADEEKIRQEIITERTERKAERDEMKANREKIKTILEKKRAGTTLTTEEQALLDNMPKMGGKGMGGRGHR